MLCFCCTTTWTSYTCMLNHFSHVRFFVTLWTVVHQASLSVRFSRQEYWSWLPCPPLGDLPDPRIEPVLRMSPASAGRLFTTSATWEAPESALCIHVSPASWAFLPTPSPFHPSRSSHSTKLSFLCHTTAFHWLLFYMWQYIYIYIYTTLSICPTIPFTPCDWTCKVQNL